MSRQAFIERVLAGQVLDLDEILDDIDEWHHRRPTESLAQWLGMTDAEYALYVERPNALRPIIQARKYSVDIHTFLTATDRSVAIAARGATQKELHELSAWLKKTGRV
jgi:hypothetical protein